jgi:gliding motility-associated-like protein
MKSAFQFSVTLLIVILIVNPTSTYSQIIFTNNNAVVYTNNNSTIFINGSLNNIGDSLFNKGEIIVNGNGASNGDLINDGLISGNGQYEITGNWINNGTFKSEESTVVLQSAFSGEQLIGGNNVSTFNNLTINGITKKRMTINTFVKKKLNLTDNELAADSFNIHVTNPNLQAIEKTTGFVSTLKSGKLLRTTGISGPYLFPVGSNLGLPRYRPVIIKPDTNSTNIFAVGFINHSAEIDGYLLSYKDASLCFVDSSFYHKITRTAGLDSADITIFFDPNVDGGIWSRIANWKSSPFNEWQNIGFVESIYSPMNGFTKSKNTDFNNEPYVLAASIPGPIPITGPLSVCSNGNSSYFALGNLLSSYNWTINGGQILGDSTSNNIQISWDTSGTGYIAVQENVNFGSCLSMPSMISINLIEPQHASFIIQPDTTVFFENDLISFINTNQNATSFYWNFGDELSTNQENPFHMFENIGTYDVIHIIADTNGCLDTANQKIEIVEGMFTPNVFTPNGDGYNDFFEIKVSGVEEFYLSIYNRWGVLVFESKSSKVKWDGKSLAGENASDGTYFYNLKAKSQTKDYSQSGSVTLLRQ